MLPTLAKIGSWFPRKNLPILLSHYKITGIGCNVFNFPYDIDVNPTDGSIWYAKLYANKLGRIDPETLEIEEFDTPAIGPRRPRFAPDGLLWIPGFDTGELVRFNPKTRQFKHFKLPTLEPNEYETPYALNVHPRTGVVWIASNMSDRIFSFDPGIEEFTNYPLPTRVTYLRDLVSARITPFFRLSKWFCQFSILKDEMLRRDIYFVLLITASDRFFDRAVMRPSYEGRSTAPTLTIG